MDRLTLAHLKKHVERIPTHSDPRRIQASRRKLKTDAPTGYAYFFADRGEKVQYVSFEPDKSTTRAMYDRLHNITERWKDVPYRVFKETINEVVSEAGPSGT